MEMLSSLLTPGIHDVREATVHYFDIHFITDEFAQAKWIELR